MEILIWALIKITLKATIVQVSTAQYCAKSLTIFQCSLCVLFPFDSLYWSIHIICTYLQYVGFLTADSVCFPSATFS
jgi:hypothetical protein